jgi:hypothetical protein
MLSYNTFFLAIFSFISSYHHQPINVPTAGARGPSAGCWVLTTANTAETNGLTSLPKHGISFILFI